MKKNIICIVMVTLLLLSFVSCSKETVETTPDTEPVVTLLVITEIRENVLIGIANEESARYSIPNWFKEYDVQQNEIIKVWHSGISLETWPMQFGDILSMEYLSLSGESIVVKKDEIVNNKIFVQKHNAVLPITKRVSDNDSKLISEYFSSITVCDELVTIDNYDYVIKMNNAIYYYNSESGILINSESNLKHWVTQKDSMNALLNKYLGGIYNG